MKRWRLADRVCGYCGRLVRSDRAFLLRALFFVIATMSVSSAFSMRRVLRLSSGGLLNVSAIDVFSQVTLRSAVNFAKRSSSKILNICMFYVLHSPTLARVAGYCTAAEYERWFREKQNPLFDLLHNPLSHVTCYTIDAENNSCVRDAAATFARNFDLACACDAFGLAGQDSNASRHVRVWLNEHQEGGAVVQIAQVKTTLADMCYSGRGGEFDYNLARRLCCDLLAQRDFYENISVSWHSRIVYMLADMCYNGKGGPRDYDSAHDLCLSLLGNAVSDQTLAPVQRANIRYMLADMCHNGPEGVADPNLAQELCKNLIDNSELDGALCPVQRANLRYMLADLCYSGPGQFLYDDVARRVCLGILEDMRLDWALTPARRADVRYMLACMFNDGRGGAVDYEHARRLARNLINCQDLYQALHPVRRANINDLMNHWHFDESCHAWVAHLSATTLQAFDGQPGVPVDASLDWQNFARRLWFQEYRATP